MIAGEDDEPPTKEEARKGWHIKNKWQERNSYTYAIRQRLLRTKERWWMSAP